MRALKSPFAAIIAACAYLAIPSWASATIYYVTGTVSFVMAQDSDFGADSDWFTLNGVSPQGGCGGGGVGSAMGIAIKDDQNGSRQYALVLAAWTAGTTISVRVDDTYKNANGVCYAEFIW